MTLSLATFVLAAFLAVYLLGRPWLNGWLHMGTENLPWRDRLLYAGGVVTLSGAVVALVVSYRKQRDTETGRFATAFAAAAQQLGDPAPSIRIAGAYAVAALADRYVDRRQQCIDVLCGYLRLPYNPDAGASHLSVRSLETTSPETHAKTTDTHAYRADDREVRLTIISIIRDHLHPKAHSSWQGHDFDFTGATFDGGDFHGAVFSGGTVSFALANFSGGVVNFRAAEFSGGTVDFRSATFSGGTVDFYGAVFSGGTVNFRLAKLSGGTVDFRSATFSSGQVSFAGATFSSGTVDFTEATFSSGQVSFTFATFSGGTVDFTRATFSGGRVSFTFATFSGGTFDLEHAWFRGPVLIVNDKIIHSPEEFFSALGPSQQASADGSAAQVSSPGQHKRVEPKAPPLLIERNDGTPGRAVP